VYRPLQFHERGQDFIRTHNETLSVILTLCDHNPKLSAFGIRA
jgi:hypothetical protein